MVTITIPKKITKGEKLIAVPKSDFESFRKWQAEVQDALAKVKRGRAEYKINKTSVVNSPKKFR